MPRRRNYLLGFRDEAHADFFQVVAAEHGEQINDFHVSAFRKSMKTAVVPWAVNRAIGGRWAGAAIRVTADLFEQAYGPAHREIVLATA